MFMFKFLPQLLVELYLVVKKQELVAQRLARAVLVLRDLIDFVSESLEFFAFVVDLVLAVVTGHLLVHLYHPQVILQHFDVG